MPRSIPDPGFAGDAGAADPRLATALAAWTHDPDAEAEVLAALAAARLLVPVVAVATAVDASGPDESTNKSTDKSTDMAVQLLEGTDGRRALPVFTSLATLARWDLAARPVPVEAARAALSARSQAAEVLVVDVAGPTSYVLTGAALRALARGHPMRPAYDDPAVVAAVAAAVDDSPDVVRHRLVPAAGVDARLVLQLRDVPGDQVAAAVARVVARLRDDEVLRSALVRGLDLAIAPPGATLHSG